MGLSGSEKISTIRLFSRFDTIPACDGPTDGPTELTYQYRTLHS